MKKNEKLIWITDEKKPKSFLANFFRANPRFFYNSLVQWNNFVTCEKYLSVCIYVRNQTTNGIEALANITPVISSGYDRSENRYMGSMSFKFIDFHNTHESLDFGTVLDNVYCPISSFEINNPLVVPRKITLKNKEEFLTNKLTPSFYDILFDRFTFIHS